jgi:hypothetical protein
VLDEVSGRPHLLAPGRSHALSAWLVDLIDLHRLAPRKWGYRKRSTAY